MIRLLTLAGLSALLLPHAALAAPVTNSNGKSQAELLIPLALLEIDDIEFGTVITSTSSGSVTIPANGSARVTAGGVTALPSDPGQRAYFIAVGEPGREIIINYSYPPKLTNLAGDQLDLLALNLLGSAVKTADPVNGQVPIYFGGTIFVAANQPEGLYEANFDVTVDYR